MPVLSDLPLVRERCVVVINLFLVRALCFFLPQHSHKVRCGCGQVPSLQLAVTRESCPTRLHNLFPAFTERDICFSLNCTYFWHLLKKLIHLTRFRKILFFLHSLWKGRLSCCCLRNYRRRGRFNFYCNVSLMFFFKIIRAVLLGDISAQKCV